MASKKKITSNVLPHVTKTDLVIILVAVYIPLLLPVAPCYFKVYCHLPSGAAGKSGGDYVRERGRGGRIQVVFGKTISRNGPRGEKAGL